MDEDFQLKELDYAGEQAERPASTDNKSTFSESPKHCFRSALK